jgi:putative peptidoglycan lipid II flippase
MILPAFGSFLVYQANIMVDKAIASFLPEGAISSLYYANRLILLPVSLFGVALSTTALPQLSLHAAKGEKEKFADTVSLGMQILVFLAIPATTGLLLFGKPIIKALFQRGAFLFKDTESVYLALFFYAFGIISYGMQRFLISAFYAMKKTLLPLKISLLALLCNVVGSLILMHPLRQGGIALATALSSFLNTFLLSLHLSKCVQIKWYNICKTAFCTLLCLPALCTCLLLYRVMGENFFSVIVCVLSAVFALIFCAKIFKIQGVELLWRRG